MANNKVVKVFNQNPFAVFAKGINRSYRFEAAQGGRAASLPLTWDDIEYINDNTELFREGYLSFAKKESAALHEELRNFDVAKTAYSPERIRDVILNPTLDKLKVITEITSLGMIERFRGDLVYLREAGDQPVASNVERVIEERYREIYNGKYRSAIVVKPAQEAPTAVDARTAELEAKIARLEALVSGKEEEVVEPKPAAPKKSTPAKKTSAAKKS